MADEFGDLNGRTLAYVGLREGDYDIYTIPVEGGEETRLTTAPGLDDGPDYSPDGEYIYFNSVRTGTMQIWRMKPDGSDPVQLTDDEKAVFRTAFEIDQRWIIELAADRTPFICQSQSVNLFLPADIHKRDLHQLHLQAWKKGVKSLYYCRSKSIQRAEVVTQNGKVPHLGKVNERDRPVERIDYEECLACQ